jgi:hypothetical protein
LAEENLASQRANREKCQGKHQWDQVWLHNLACEREGMVGEFACVIDRKVSSPLLAIPAAIHAA